MAVRPPRPALPRATIRPLGRADAEAVRRIYNAEVLGSTATFDLRPRTPEEQERWVQDHLGAYPAVVAEVAGRVVGFASVSPYRRRPAYATTVEDSVYVDAEARGQGLGRQLLEELLVQAARHGFHTVLARIEATNQASIALHQGCGFEPVGLEREVGRKFGRWLDVCVLQRLL
ncbi:GNAT family N-acetyltransferase [Aciditerrimonas ferrireducens]|uniref:GNAT family N-acetyltransferase n=1 Tax=Aciditerrimonas ferrireducens TaxID=667306 RepID=A0ABV6C125_9ACTN